MQNSGRKEGRIEILPWQIENDRELRNLNSYDYLYYVVESTPDFLMTRIIKDIPLIYINNTQKQSEIEEELQKIETVWIALKGIMKDRYTKYNDYGKFYTNFFLSLESNIQDILEACNNLDAYVDENSEKKYSRELYNMIDKIYNNPCQAVKRSADMIKDSVRGVDVKRAQKKVTKRLTASGPTRIARLTQSVQSFLALGITPSHENSTLKSIKNVYGKNVRPMFTTRIPGIRDVQHHKLYPYVELSMGMQAKIENDIPGIYNIFQAWLSLSYKFETSNDPRHAITHLYFNSLALDRESNINNIKDRGITECIHTKNLHKLEEKHPNIAIITFPSENGFLDEKLLENKGEPLSFDDTFDRIIDVVLNYDTPKYPIKLDKLDKDKTDKEKRDEAWKTVKDFHLSHRVYDLLYTQEALRKLQQLYDPFFEVKEDSIEKSCLFILLKESFNELSFDQDKMFTSADQLAVFFHFIKYQLPNFMIGELKPKRIQFSCRDTIDRGNMASIYRKLIDSIMLSAPMSEDEFFEALYGPAAMVKARGINFHVLFALNSIDVFIRSQDKKNLAHIIPTWLRKWRDENIKAVLPQLGTRGIDFTNTQTLATLRNAINKMNEEEQLSNTLVINGVHKFSIIKRRGENEETNRTYYELLGPPLGQSRHTVFDVIARIEVFQDGQLLIMAQPFVAKEFTKKVRDVKTPYEKMQIEYEVMKEIKDHTHVKKGAMLFDYNIAFLFSRKMLGKKLSQFKININPLNRDALLNVLRLTREIGRATQRQVHGKLIHYDIKPDNIMVNLNKPRYPLAQIFDFDQSRNKKYDLQPDQIPEGTASYADPELAIFHILNLKAHGASVKFFPSEKSDVYSLGIILLEMLGGESKIKTQRDINQHLIRVKEAYDKTRQTHPDISIYELYRVYKDAPSYLTFPTDIPEELKDLILKTTEPDSSKRASMDEALTSFDLLIINYSNINNEPEFKKNKLMGLEFGKKLKHLPILTIIEELKKHALINEKSFMDECLDALDIKALYPCHSMVHIEKTVNACYQTIDDIIQSFIQIIEKTLAEDEHKKLVLITQAALYRDKLITSKKIGDLDTIEAFIKASPEKLRKLIIRLEALSIKTDIHLVHESFEANQDIKILREMIVEACQLLDEEVQAKIIGLLAPIKTVTEVIKFLFDKVNDKTISNNLLSAIYKKIILAKGPTDLSTTFQIVFVHQLFSYFLTDYEAKATRYFSGHTRTITLDRLQHLNLSSFVNLAHYIEYLQLEANAIHSQQEIGFFKQKINMSEMEKHLNKVLSIYHETVKTNVELNLETENANNPINAIKLIRNEYIIKILKYVSDIETRGLLIDGFATNRARFASKMACQLYTKRDAQAIKNFIHEQMQLMSQLIDKKNKLVNDYSQLTRFLNELNEKMNSQLATNEQTSNLKVEVRKSY